MNEERNWKIYRYIADEAVRLCPTTGKTYMERTEQKKKEISVLS